MSDMKSEKKKRKRKNTEMNGSKNRTDHPAGSCGEQKIHLLTIIGEVEGHENLAEEFQDDEI